MEVDDSFFNTIAFLKDLRINCFEITGGGEPFLHPNLQVIVSHIRGNFPDAYIKLYTNGRIKKIYDCINELNISVIHWDTKRICEICKGSSSYDLIDTLSYFRENFLGQIRLSIPMLKQGISKTEDAQYLIDITRKYVDKYVFRPMNMFVSDYESMSTVFDCDMLNVEIDKEFCSCNEINLWFSDNNIYKKWDLSM
jgi:molybdenum cofactor biosynthesis enzyme MoaA